MNHLIMLKSQQANSFFLKSPRLTNMPLGNLKKIGIISKNPYQVYVPFNPNEKTLLAKKEPAVSEVEQTSFNESPSF